MTKVQQILNDFQEIRRKGYGTQLPGECDAKFIQLAEIYAKSDTAKREVIRASVPIEFSSLLIGFGGRLAIIAERTGNRRLVFLALLAHSIEDFRMDDRDNIIALALVNHVIMKMGERPADLFKTAALLSSPKGAADLLAFNKRIPEMKSLRVMGIEEFQTADGVDYRRG